MALINARSLRSKLISLKNVLNELAVDVCLLTETWFKQTDKINSELEDFKHQCGYLFLRKDRQSDRRGGGVAVCYNASQIQFSKAKIPPSKHEVYAAVGRRTGQRRKVVVVVVYIPPYYNADQNRSLFRYTNDAVLALKSKYEDPYIVFGGDFNRRKFKLAVEDFPQIKEIRTGPTRGNAVLDILSTNFNDSLTDSGVVAAICNEDGVETDHGTVYASFRMPRVPSYSIEQYTYNHITEEGHNKFEDWLMRYDWAKITSSTDVDEAVGKLHEAFEEGVRQSYVTKTRKKKSSEPPWMTDWLRDDIATRRRIFKTDQGRTDRWKHVKQQTNAAVKKRRKKFNELVIRKFEEEKNPGKFFQHIKSLTSKNSGSKWSPKQMFPGLDSGQAADRLANFFNAISNQYQPLSPTDIPSTFRRDLPDITPAQVEEKLKKAKKPSSMVPGDVPSAIYSMYPASLSPIIAHIFNLITSKKQWPSPWKIEYVTIIPKKPDPQEPSECRNISCTNFLSKLYESFLLEWSREEVVPKLNQYGGEPAASATQLLVEVISDVTTALEDNRAGVVLSAIDFSKAFNRLDHRKVLGSFAKRGSSSDVLALLASFLGGRQMTVRLEQSRSALLPVNAGAPQGSVLGCYLFNVGVDDLEEDFTCDSGMQEEAHKETLTRTDDYPAMSTPTRVAPQASPTDSPIQAREAVKFAILPRVANVPHWVPKPKDPTFTDSKANTYKYVDDQVNTSKVNMRKARMLVEDGVFFKEIIDLRTQNLLQHIATRAEDRGMQINAKKTSLMLVSAATSFQPRVCVELGGELVKGSDKLKILGVTLDSDASFRTHVARLASKMRSKTWALSKLRKIGVDQSNLVKIYKRLIRPTAEYASPSWHSLLSASQASDLERQQTQALRNIFGPGLSANKMRLKSDTELLSTRREKAAKKFAKKNLHNPRCTSWFLPRQTPKYARRSNVNYPSFRENVSRTDRHRNTPKNFLIRKLNEPD